MGLFDKLGFGKSNKHDVKLAKIDLAKEKMEKKEAKKMLKEQKRIEMIEQAKTVSNYTANNFQSFYDVVSNLVIETRKLISNINDTKLSNKEKRKSKETAKENLNYLYLAKEYFVFVNKIENGLTLTDNQYIYVNKFHPFFDGTKVIITEEDDSLFGAFKEVGREFVGAFVSSASMFSFEDYLKNYEDQIKKYIIPDFEQFKTLFMKVNNNNKHDKTIVKAISGSNTEKIECPNCKSRLNSDAKFCTECGMKIEVVKNKFCSECGAKLLPKDKFCSDCGTKVL